MSDKDFINSKLLLMKEDKQTVFTGFVGPLQEMAQQGELGKKVQIPVDGNWFTVSFDAIQVKEDRLVISAARTENGLVANPRDPTEKQYVVEFAGTRAAYLKGYYNPHHVAFGWPYISWDVRAYAKHTIDSNKRVYVHGFYAHEELRKLIVAMEGAYGASNIFNTYINDNLARFQLGIQAGKDPQKIEKEWSRGLMESLGYKHVEAFGFPKGSWREVKVHWCKKNHDLRS